LTVVVGEFSIHMWRWGDDGKGLCRLTEEKGMKRIKKEEEREGERNGL